MSFSGLAPPAKTEGLLLSASKSPLPDIASSCSLRKLAKAHLRRLFLRVWPIPNLCQAMRLSKPATGFPQKLGPTCDTVQLNGAIGENLRGSKFIAATKINPRVVCNGKLTQKRLPQTSFWMTFWQPFAPENVSVGGRLTKLSWMRCRTGENRNELSFTGWIVENRNDKANYDQ